MSFIPTQQQLHGLTFRRAELMGKPHIGAFFLREDAHTNQLENGARCTVCGKQAKNSHHIVPLSVCRSWNLETPLGIFVLMSPLFALCGSGTTGCHNGFHGGARYTVEWVWDSEEYQEAWWSGHTLAHVCPPHSTILFRQGHYELTDKKTNKIYKLGGK